MLNTSMGTIAILFLLGYFLTSSGEGSRNGSKEIAWEFIAGNGTNIHLLYRNFYTDFMKRDNIKCSTGTKVSLNNSAHSAVYTTLWYNVTANKTYKIKSIYAMEGNYLSATHTYGNGTDTDNYTFVYSDGKCSVTLVPNYNEAAKPCNIACEVWVREECIYEMNPKCEDAYTKSCGGKKIPIYNQTYCYIMNNQSKLVDLT